MTHQVKLPDHVDQIVQRTAEQQGMTPAEWITATVSQIVTGTTTVSALRSREPVYAREGAKTGELPLKDVLHGLVGSFDSSTEQYGGREAGAMADMVADKLQREGIDVPWRQQR